MKNNEIRQIEDEIAILEDGIIELQTYGAGMPIESQDTYDLQMSELEDRMENIRETFGLLRGADTDTWSDVREVFFNGIEELRLMVDRLKEEYGPIAYRIYYESLR